MYTINHTQCAAHASDQSILFEFSYTNPDLSPDTVNVYDKSYKLSGARIESVENVLIFFYSLGTYSSFNYTFFFSLDKKTAINAVQIGF